MSGLDLRAYANVLRSEAAAGLSHGARFLAWVLLSYSGDDGVCWPSHATLQKGTGFSRKHVNTLLDELEAARWIERKSGKREGRSSTYRLSLRGSEVALGVSPGGDRGVTYSTQGVSPGGDRGVTYSTQGVSPGGDTELPKELPRNYQLNGAPQEGGAASSSPKNKLQQPPKLHAIPTPRGDSGSPPKSDKRTDYEISREMDAVLDWIEQASPEELAAVEAGTLLPPALRRSEVAAPPARPPRSVPSPEDARRLDTHNKKLAMLLAQEEASR
jgi:hypothetical protein